MRMSHRRQKGAVGFLLIALSFLLLTVSMLTIDVVRLHNEKHRLQNLADITALEVTHKTNILGGYPLHDPEVIALETLNRHGFDTHDQKRQMSVRVGRVEVVDGHFHFINVDHQQEFKNAIEIHLHKTIPTLVISGINRLLLHSFDDWITIEASAVAMQTASTTFSYGSGLATVSVENSPLLSLVFNELLQTNVDLDLLSFKGVLDTSLSLLQLSQELFLLGVDLSLVTLDELLKTSVDVADILRLTAVIAERNNANPFDILRLNQIAQASGLSGHELVLEQIFNVPAHLNSKDDVIAEAQFNYFDFLTASLLAANQDRAIHLQINDLQFLNQLTSLLGINIDLSLDLQVISPPQIAIGPPGLIDYENREFNTEAVNSQLGLVVGAQLSLPLSLINLDLAIAVNAAAGRAGLEGLDFEEREALFKLYPSLANVSLGSFASQGQEPAEISIKLLGIPVAEILLGAKLGSNMENQDEVSIRVSFDDIGVSQRETSSLVGSVAGLISSLPNLSVQVKLLGIELGIINSLLNPIINELSNVLTPLLQVIANQLVDPIISFLGVGTTYSDVTLIDVNHSSVILVR